MLCNLKRLCKRCTILEAFTLAEVLITLGIIGIVAAMTLPVLINKQRDAAIIAHLKKIYSILGQVVYELNYEYSGDWDDIDIFHFGDDVTKRVKILKVCKNIQGCFEQTPVKYLNGGQATNWNEYADSEHYKFVLIEGTNLMIEYGFDSTAFAWDKAPRFLITVDVNGIKRPNVYGRDVFAFGVRDGKLIPSGIDNESANCKTLGYTCAWKVLNEGKFTY